MLDPTHSTFAQASINAARIKVHRDGHKEMVASKLSHRLHGKCGGQEAVEQFKGPRRKNNFFSGNLAPFADKLDEHETIELNNASRIYPMGNKLFATTSPAQEKSALRK